MSADPHGTGMLALTTPVPAQDEPIGTHGARLAKHVGLDDGQYVDDCSQSANPVRVSAQSERQRGQYFGAVRMSELQRRDVVAVETSAQAVSKVGASVSQSVSAVRTSAQSDVGAVRTSDVGASAQSVCRRDGQDLSVGNQR